MTIYTVIENCQDYETEYGHWWKITRICSYHLTQEGANGAIKELVKKAAETHRAALKNNPTADPVKWEELALEIESNQITIHTWQGYGDEVKEQMPQYEIKPLIVQP